MPEYVIGSLNVKGRGHLIAAFKSQAATVVLISGCQQVGLPMNEKIKNSLTQTPCDRPHHGHNRARSVPDSEESETTCRPIDNILMLPIQ